MSTLIKNGRIITAEQDYLADVFIENGKIKESEYVGKMEKEFLKTYNQLVKKYNIELNNHSSKSRQTMHRNLLET